MNIFDISKHYRELTNAPEAAETDQQTDTGTQSRNTAPGNAHNSCKDTFEKAPSHGSPVSRPGNSRTRFIGLPAEGTKYGHTYTTGKGSGGYTEILDKDGKRIGFRFGGVPSNSDKPAPEVPKENPTGSPDSSGFANNGFTITTTRKEDGSTEIEVRNRQGQLIPVLHAHNHAPGESSDVEKKDSKDEKPANEVIRYDIPPERLRPYVDPRARQNVRMKPKEASSLPPPKPIDLGGNPEPVFEHPPGSRPDSTTNTEQ